MYYDAIILRDCENMNLQPEKEKMHRRILIFTDFEFHFLGGGGGGGEHKRIKFDL